jgi:hypothetical protein
MSHLTLKGRPLAACTVAGLNRIPTFARNPISLSDERGPLVKLTRILRPCFGIPFPPLHLRGLASSLTLLFCT